MSEVSEDERYLRLTLRATNAELSWGEPCDASYPLALPELQITGGTFIPGSPHSGCRGSLTILPINKRREINTLVGDGYFSTNRGTTIVLVYYDPISKDDIIATFTAITPPHVRTEFLMDLEMTTETDFHIREVWLRSGRQGHEDSIAW